MEKTFSIISIFSSGCRAAVSLTSGLSSTEACSFSCRGSSTCFVIEVKMDVPGVSHCELSFSPCL
jgi:hypothetical protein